MKIGIVGFEKDGVVDSIKNKLESIGVKVIDIDKEFSILNELELVIVLGGDKGILQYFHEVKGESPPVLGVYESDSTGFLAQIDLKDILNAIQMIKHGNYQIDEVSRIAVNIDGKYKETALNDVAIFPFRSATLMEHKLRIDEEDIWHDNSDGIIISTPLGSTAYAMSAGGPMVLRRAKVFIVVSINSLDVTRRPLIVPDESKIEIDEIISRYHCEVIIDGDKRFKVNNKVICTKDKYLAKLIRFPNQTRSVIAKKVKLAEDMLGMPPSAKLVLKILEYEGPMSQREIINRTMLPARTVRLALSHLINKGYVKKKVSLRDARQRIYELRL